MKALKSNLFEYQTVGQIKAKWKVWRLFSAGAIAGLFLISCSSKESTEQKKPATVFVKPVQLETISDVLTYPARVRARVNSTILSESDGIISEISVTLGKQVQPQQSLMMLQHTDPVYRYAPVSIRAPVQGIVSSIEVTQGSHVVVGQKLASVINPSQLEVQVEIPAQDLAVISKGMVGEFKIPNFEAPIQIRVIGVSPFVDPSTGTALAQLSLVQKKHPILSPGLQGQVIFRANLHEGFRIPESSVVYRGKDSFVRVVEGKKAKQIPIVLGSKQRGMVEIMKGLAPGVLLIERSSRFIVEGEEVGIENGAKSADEKSENPPEKSP